jgi:hypothetical protein
MTDAGQKIVELADTALDAQRALRGELAAGHIPPVALLTVEQTISRMVSIQARCGELLAMEGED